MTVPAETLWPRYAQLWSTDAAARAERMSACLVDGVHYTDPNVALNGQEALHGYMAGFQQAMPGCAFHIDQVKAHHDRSLAWWRLRAADGQTLQHGMSSARHAEDGRLAEITGFFPLDAA